MLYSLGLKLLKRCVDKARSQEKWLKNDQKLELNLWFIYLFILLRLFLTIYFGSLNFLLVLRCHRQFLELSSSSLSLMNEQNFFTKIIIVGKVSKTISSGKKIPIPITDLWWILTFMDFWMQKSIDSHPIQRLLTVSSSWLLRLWWSQIPVHLLSEVTLTEFTRGIGEN